mmetsp:Transcript_47931/g.125494  ORF Transcript_47931/g.125494 Transcript_47931/m.125494 type:complete len:193 (-) Transcript_47931:102-680(-)
MQTTNATTCDAAEDMCIDNQPDGNSMSGLTCCPLWKPGVERPPFTSSNMEVVDLLVNLVTGATDTVGIVNVSEAVVVQIYELLFKTTGIPIPLLKAGWRGLYIILASLALTWFKLNRPEDERLAPPMPSARGLDWSRGYRMQISGAPCKQRPITSLLRTPKTIGGLSAHQDGSQCTGGIRGLAEPRKIPVVD